MCVVRLYYVMYVVHVLAAMLLVDGRERGETRRRAIDSYRNGGSVGIKMELLRVLSEPLNDN